MCQRPRGWHVLVAGAIAAVAACGEGRVAVSVPPPTMALPASPPDAGALAAALPLVPRPRVVVPCTPGIALDGSETVEESGPPDDESYVLDVADGRASIRANRRAGLLRARITRDALAGVSPAPCLHVEDAPRTRFRGMHLDVARHFFPKAVVERYLELIAFYKFNVFHWHLSDDQGFRLELKKHPELTAVGGRDGFYTQDDVREVVAFAAEHGITVVPEIDMPGHTRAILAAHPELSCTGKKLEVPRTWGIFEDVLCPGNDATFALVGDVLDELVALFPGPWIHVGGDEVPTTRWSKCPKCAARMKAENVSVERLEGWFMDRVTKMAAARGRRAMVWDEALDAQLPKDVVVAAWQNEARGAAAASAGYDVLMAPQDRVYFNIHQSRTGAEPGARGWLPWERVRSFDPGVVPRLLGAEGALWTEHVTTQDEIDELVAPRIAALADALWSGPSAAGDFEARFTAQRPMLDAMKIRYFVDAPRGWKAKKAFIDEATVAFEPPSLFPDGVVRYTTDGRTPTATSPAATAPLTFRDTTRLALGVFLPGGRSSPVVHETVEKQRPRPAVPAPPATYVSCKYYEGDFHVLPDFAHLTPRWEGTCPGVGLLDRFRQEHFAVAFDGWMNAPQTAAYRFVTRADDGVRVLVDGETVVDDDGEHEPHEAEGEIALEAGFHRMRVLYFQGDGAKALAVRFAISP